MKQPFVSIIIVTWNGRHYVKKCLKSLSTCTYTNCEIIVVDNNSADGTVPWLEKTYPHVRILKLAKNVGFAQGNNEGYRASKGEFIIFLNNDTVVHPSFITEMVKKWQEDTNIGGVQSKLLLMNDRKYLDSVGAFFTWSGFLYHWGFGKKDSKRYDETKYLFTVKGACMGFPKRVLESVLIDDSVFDPVFFSYFEETDLCHRIWLSGKKILYAPAAIVYHTVGGTSTGMDNAFIQFHSYKNRISSYVRNFEWKHLWFLPFHIALCLCIGCMLTIGGKWRYGFAVFRSIFWNIRNLPDTLKKRRYIQKCIRQVSDKAYMRHVLVFPRIGYYRNLFLGTVGKSKIEWIKK